MNPHFMEKYGDILQQQINCLLAYHQIEDHELSQRLQQPGWCADDVKALCAVIDLPYLTLLNYAQQSSLFPLHANADNSQVACFYQQQELRPYLNTSCLAIQPAAVDIDTPISCGTGCWSADGQYFYTAFYSVLPERSNAFNPAVFSVATGQWLAAEHSLSGNVLAVTCDTDNIMYDIGIQYPVARDTFRHPLALLHTMADEPHERRYILGEGFSGTVGTGSECPYGIAYDTGRDQQPFLLWEGAGMLANACWLSPAQILLSTWKENLQICQCEWLVPLLQRMANGEIIAVEALCDAYRQHHGKAPRVEKI